MRSVTLLLTLLALVATTAEASRYVEPILVPLTGEGYQFDGGVEMDASDSCARPEPAVPLGGAAEGTLVPVDDEEDNFALPIPASQLGALVTIELAPGPTLADLTKSGAASVTAPAPSYDLEVWGPGCSFLVGVGGAGGASVERVTFAPERAGTYTIRIVAGAIGAEVDPLPHGRGDPLAPQERECHGFCVAKANGLIGYSLATSN